MRSDHSAGGDSALSKRRPWPGSLEPAEAVLANPDLVLTWHGPGQAGIRRANWAVSLRHRGGAVDLTGQAQIRWRAKQSGFRQRYWRMREFNVADLRRRTLDIGKVVKGRWAAGPDLRRVMEVGFTDPMRGGGIPACSRVDWIEVYGTRARAAADTGR